MFCVFKTFIVKVTINGNIIVDTITNPTKLIVPILFTKFFMLFCF